MNTTTIDLRGDAPHRIARLTGAAYVGIILAGTFAEFFVRASLVVPGDAATTATNIATSAGLFRAGIAADVVMIALDVAVAVGLYLLLRPVHRSLAILAAAFRMVQAAILGANLFNLVDALSFATGPFAGDPRFDALALSSMQTQALAYDLGLVFFGLACLALGHLLRVSEYVPGILALGLSLAGVVYLVGSFAAVLAPGLAAAIDPAYALPVLAEIGVAGWLTVKGVSRPTAPRPAAIPTAA